MKAVPFCPTVRRHSRPATTVAASVLLAAALTACSTSSTSGTAANSEEVARGSAGRGKVLHVVAAENFWGSIATQLGGKHVEVTSLIDSPAADPHAYEPTAADARAVAMAQYTVANGIGYDTWFDKLLATDRGEGRTDLNVGEVVGVEPGGNPHRWYSPEDVHRVVEQITADYKKHDPGHATDFEALKNTFETKSLAAYDRLTSELRARYSGTPIGASESIVSPLAEGLGLRMLTPYSFLSAISEGGEPTLHDKQLTRHQMANRQIKIYVYNSQNATPDIRRQVAEAEAADVPVATVTETPTPAGVSFQDWQIRELRGLRRALARATGART